MRSREPDLFTQDCLGIDYRRDDCDRLLLLPDKCHVLPDERCQLVRFGGVQRLLDRSLGRQYGDYCKAPLAHDMLDPVVQQERTHALRCKSVVLIRWLCYTEIQSLSRWSANPSFAYSEVKPSHVQYHKAYL